MDAFRANAERTNQNLDRTNQNIEAMLQIMTQSLQRMEVMESDIRGLQTENRRILDIFQQRNMGHKVLFGLERLLEYMIRRDQGQLE